MPPGIPTAQELAFIMAPPACCFLMGFLLTLALGLAGCGTTSGGRRWGAGATLVPGWERTGQAARSAALAPETWIPAAGALALQIGDADHEVAEWAARTTPIYGSQENADEMSDVLKETSGALWVVSGLVTPSGDDAGEWARNKLRGFSVQFGSGFLLRETVGLVKATDRTRPNGLGESFPSAHAASASHYNTMAAMNLETLEWGRGPMMATRIGLGALTAATSWARVEAHQHYPSDVLAGMALGHFFGAFFTGAFLGLDAAQAHRLVLAPSADGAAARVAITF
jgi:hypothetical protein